jgi:hypothetical protein
MGSKRSSAKRIEENLNRYEGKLAEENVFSKIDTWMQKKNKRAIDVFRLGDKNCDGVLSKDEFCTAVLALNLAYTEEDVIRMIERLFAHNDEISHVEFDSTLKVHRLEALEAKRRKNVLKSLAISPNLIPRFSAFAAEV